MKIKEVRELDNQALVEKIGATQAQLHQMKLNHAVSPLGNPSQIKATRRDIKENLINKTGSDGNKKFKKSKTGCRCKQQDG